MTLKGQNEFFRDLNQFNKKFARAEKLARMDTMLKIGEITSSAVPVDKGLLKSSFLAIENSNTVVGGYNVEYAALQHQGYGMRKLKNGKTVAILIRNRPGGGQSFFLTGPIQRNRIKLLQFHAERLNTRL